ncbi:MAG: hypothetical protein KDA66_12725, partial [Planctomycetaceae bacterium]|nr:hypothetical protein [Planctomycetaceae bacterium]
QKCLSHNPFHLPTTRIPRMEYKVRPIGKTCAQTGEPLEPGSHCMSVLVERDGVLERLDYNVSSWEGPPEGTVGFWKCDVPVPETKPVTQMDPNALMGLFEQMVDEQQPAREKLLYVLTLYLLQRRRLQLDGSELREDGEFLLISGSRGEGPFEIRNHQMADDEIKQLQSALAVQLNSEWGIAS